MRYKPDCPCARQDFADVETRVIMTTIAGIMSVEQNCNMQQLCRETHEYTMMTLITSIVFGMATEPDRPQEGVNEERYERVLSTLVQDIRDRRAMMDAQAEKNQMTGRTQ